MSKRWRWSRNKVRLFLKWLEKDGKTVQQTKQQITTILTLVNYEQYQSEGTTNETTEGQQKDNRRYTNKNDKNVNNEKKTHTETLNSYKNIDSLTPEVITEVSKAYEVSEFDVNRLKEELRLYTESTGKKYLNYKATLMAWVRRKLEEGKIASHSKPVVKTRLFDLVPEENSI